MRTIMSSSFLRGMGVGLIVAGLLFLAWPSREALTDQEIIARAKKLGMVTQAELAQAKDAASKAKMQALEPAQPAPKAKTVNQVKITIPQGATSERVAAILTEKGLVQDAKKFLELANRKHLATKFRTGSFTLTKDMSMEDILLRLTGK